MNEFKCQFHKRLSRVIRWLYFRKLNLLKTREERFIFAQLCKSFEFALQVLEIDNNEGDKKLSASMIKKTTCRISLTHKFDTEEEK